MKTASIAPVVEGFKIYLVLSQLHKISSPVHERISEWARLTPHALAVRHGLIDLSYEELDQRSNIIAHYLLSRGIQKEDCIGVYLQESVLVPVVILGILKAGATYVPLSTELPEKRINRILEDADIRLVFADEGRKEFFSAGLCPVQELDTSFRLIPEHHTGRVPLSGKHEDAAYIIYTSGSTGDPKGVIVSHGSMVNYLDWYLEDLYQQSQASLPLSSSISFAAGVTQLFSALMLGETLHIINRSDVKQPARLLDWYRHHPGHALYCVPTLWEEVMNYVESQDDTTLVPPACLYLSGESLSKQLVDRSFRRWPGLRIWNLYGPTEATANVSYYKVEKERDIYLGKPIRGARLLLLDEHLNPVPQGEEGFIYVTSQALAREYRNKPELSRRSFLTDHQVPGFEGCTLYNTGDVGRFTADNELLFLGRKDQQVKIRGHRIELSEIEKFLQGIEGIRQAACKVMPDKQGQDRIHAFVVCSEGTTLSIPHIRTQLLQQLPAYMLPEVFHFLEAMPKLGNGKINRNELLPEATDNRNGLTAPHRAAQTAEEKTLLEIWSEVLEITNPGMHDDFFDLGGNSLKMIRLAGLITKKMGRKISTQHLWDHTTPATLMAHLNTAAAIENSNSIAPQSVSRKTSPLSLQQMGMWFTLQSRPGLTAYNMLFSLSIEGPAQPERVQQTLNRVLQQHDILRSGFRIENRYPIRFVRESMAVHLPLTDLSHLPPDAAQAEEQALCERLLAQTPDLAEDDLVCFHLLRSSDTRHKLYVGVHHIIFDGLSINLFSKAFAQAWNEEPHTAQATISYADYAGWEKKSYFDEKLESSLTFWKQQLEGANHFLNLPTDFPRPKVQGNSGSKKTLVLESALLEQLGAFNRKEKSTSFVVLLSVFQVLLHRYTREQDILTGVPFANRTSPETRSLMGLLVNTLVFRAHCRPELSFRELLQSMRRYTAQALEHQSYPFSRLVEQLNPERSVSHHPLFQVLFAYHNVLDRHTCADGTLIRAEEIQNPSCKFDLEVEAQENEDNITLCFRYSTELFHESTITAMMEQFRFLLLQALAQPGATIGSYQTEEEAPLLHKLADWNNTTADIPAGCLHEQFEQQALHHPEQTAVRWNGGSMSYQTLNRQANRMAHALRSRGAQPDQLIGIVCDRSPEMMAGILGILKAGAAYLPIDPKAPQERIAYTISNSRMSLLLAQEPYTGLAGEAVEVLSLNDDQWYAACSQENPAALAQPQHLAYVIYTSGSTGQPKGVMIEHRSAMNRIAWMQKAYALNRHDVILQKTPITFDVSVWELFWWFFSGSSLYLLEPGGEKNPESILQAIREQNISTLHFVPSMFSTFLEYVQDNRPDAAAFKSLRRVFTSGEALEKHHVQKFYHSIAPTGEVQLVNLYGPTEATVDVSFFDCAAAGWYARVPIGRPIDNTVLYILDENGHPLPEKIPGELCIGGAGLARGYLHNPSLTEEKFFHSALLNTRLYRSGDLARWLPDGNIEYLGRTDHQVKIRGFRIELGEIENGINRHPDVEASAALVKKAGHEDMRLVAYFIPRNRRSNIDLKTHLRAFLPDYMIPSVFVPLESFPLLPSGKLDIKALPEPFEGRQKSIGQRSYHNEYEKRIASIWTQMLKHDAFDTEDNFYDAGGYSLLLVRMKMVLDNEFGMDISLVDLFQYPTIRSLAEVIATRTRMQQKNTIANRAQLQRAASRPKRP